MHAGQKREKARERKMPKFKQLKQEDIVSEKNKRVCQKKKSTESEWALLLCVSHLLLAIISGRFLYLLIPRRRMEILKIGNDPSRRIAKWSTSTRLTKGVPNLDFLWGIRWMRKRKFLHHHRSEEEMNTWWTQSPQSRMGQINGRGKTKGEESIMERVGSEYRGNTPTSCCRARAAPTFRVLRDSFSWIWRSMWYRIWRENEKKRIKRNTMEEKGKSKKTTSLTQFTWVRFLSLPPFVRFNVLQVSLCAREQQNSTQFHSPTVKNINSNI